MSELHQIYGLNLSIEQCKYCSEDGAILFYGNTIEGQAPSITPIECSARCVLKGMTVLVEQEGEKDTGYCVSLDFSAAFKLGLPPGKWSISSDELKKMMGEGYKQYGDVKIKTKG